MRYKINFVNEKLILSLPLFVIIIKQILTKNLKNEEVLVIGRSSFLVVIFIATLIPVTRAYFCLGSFSETVAGLCFVAEH